jgi:hypothetical protein
MSGADDHRPRYFFSFVYLPFGKSLVPLELAPVDIM